MEIRGKKIIKIISVVLVFTLLVQEISRADGFSFFAHKSDLQIQSFTQPISNPVLQHESYIKFTLKYILENIVTDLGQCKRRIFDHSLVPGKGFVFDFREDRKNEHNGKRKEGSNWVVPCAVGNIEDIRRDHLYKWPYEAIVNDDKEVLYIRKRGEKRYRKQETSDNEQQTADIRQRFFRNILDSGWVLSVKDAQAFLEMAKAWDEDQCAEWDISADLLKDMKKLKTCNDIAVAKDLKTLQGISSIKYGRRNYYYAEDIFDTEEQIALAIEDVRELRKYGVVKQNIRQRFFKSILCCGQWLSVKGARNLLEDAKSWDEEQAREWNVSPDLLNYVKGLRSCSREMVYRDLETLKGVRSKKGEDGRKYYYWDITELKGSREKIIRGIVSSGFFKVELNEEELNRLVEVFSDAGISDRIAGNIAVLTIVAKIVVNPEAAFKLTLPSAGLSVKVCIVPQKEIDYWTEKGNLNPSPAVVIINTEETDPNPRVMIAAELVENDLVSFANEIGGLVLHETTEPYVRLSRALKQVETAKGIVVAAAKGPKKKAGEGGKTATTEELEHEVARSAEEDLAFLEQFEIEDIYANDFKKELIELKTKFDAQVSSIKSKLKKRKDQSVEGPKAGHPDTEVRADNQKAFDKLLDDNEDIRPLLEREQQVFDEKNPGKVLDAGKLAIQIDAARNLARGKMYKIPMGFGKTLTLRVAAYIMANNRNFVKANKQGVLVSTSNDTLAGRDAREAAEVLAPFGIKVGYVTQGSEGKRIGYIYDHDEMTGRAKERKLKSDGETYKEADIIYGTIDRFIHRYEDEELSSPYGEYHRDHDPDQVAFMGPEKKGFLSDRQYHMLFDEVDNPLIYQAMNPFIVSGSKEGKYAKARKKAYIQARHYAEEMADPEKGLIDVSKESQKSIKLTDDGTKWLAKRLKSDNPVPELNAGISQWGHIIEQLLIALRCYEETKEYVIRDAKDKETGEDIKEIVLIDKTSGEEAPGRRLSYGMHMALEVKHMTEGVKVNTDKMTKNTMTSGIFLSKARTRDGRKLIADYSGASGTIDDDFMESVYDKKPVTPELPKEYITQRIDEVNMFKTEKDKADALVQDVEKVAETSAPILIKVEQGGADDMENKIRTLLGDKRTIVKFDALADTPIEDIEKNCGKEGVITIVTNRGGRGVDIKISAATSNIGGIVSYSTYIDELAATDMQYRGRVARNPGEQGLFKAFWSCQDKVFDVYKDIPAVKTAKAALLTEINARRGSVREDSKTDRTVISDLIDAVREAIMQSKIQQFKESKPFEAKMEKDKKELKSLRDAFIKIVVKEESDTDLEKKLNNALYFKVKGQKVGIVSWADNMQNNKEKSVFASMILSLFDTAFSGYFDTTGQARDELNNIMKDAGWMGQAAKSDIYVQFAGISRKARQEAIESIKREMEKLFTEIYPEEGAEETVDAREPQKEEEEAEDITGREITPPSIKARDYLRKGIGYVFGGAMIAGSWYAIKYIFSGMNLVQKMLTAEVTPPFMQDIATHIFPMIPAGGWVVAAAVLIVLSFAVYHTHIKRFSQEYKGERYIELLLRGEASLKDAGKAIAAVPTMALLMLSTAGPIAVLISLISIAAFPGIVSVGLPLTAGLAAFIVLANGIIAAVTYKQAKKVQLAQPSGLQRGLRAMSFALTYVTAAVLIYTLVPYTAHMVISGLLLSAVAIWHHTKLHSEYKKALETSKPGRMARLGGTVLSSGIFAGVYWLSTVIGAFPPIFMILMATGSGIMLTITIMYFTAMPYMASRMAEVQSRATGIEKKALTVKEFIESSGKNVRGIAIGVGSLFGLIQIAGAIASGMSLITLSATGIIGGIFIALLTKAFLDKRNQVQRKVAGGKSPEGMIEKAFFELDNNTIARFIMRSAVFAIAAPSAATGAILNRNAASYSQSAQKEGMEKERAVEILKQKRVVRQEEPEKKIEKKTPRHPDTPVSSQGTKKGANLKIDEPGGETPSANKKLGKKEKTSLESNLKTDDPLVPDKIPRGPGHRENRENLQQGMPVIFDKERSDTSPLFPAEDKAALDVEHVPNVGLSRAKKISERKLMSYKEAVEAYDRFTNWMGTVSGEDRSVETLKLAMRSVLGQIADGRLKVNWHGFGRYNLAEDIYDSLESTFGEDAMEEDPSMVLLALAIKHKESPELLKQILGRYDAFTVKTVELFVGQNSRKKSITDILEMVMRNTYQIREAKRRLVEAATIKDIAESGRLFLEIETDHSLPEEGPAKRELENVKKRVRENAVKFGEIQRNLAEEMATLQKNQFRLKTAITEGNKEKASKEQQKIDDSRKKIDESKEKLRLLDEELMNDLQKMRDLRESELSIDPTFGLNLYDAEQVQDIRAKEAMERQIRIDVDLAKIEITDRVIQLYLDINSAKRKIRTLREHLRGLEALRKKNSSFNLHTEEIVMLDICITKAGSELYEQEKIILDSKTELRYIMGLPAGFPFELDDEWYEREKVGDLVSGTNINMDRYFALMLAKKSEEIEFYRSSLPDNVFEWLNLKSGIVWEEDIFRRILYEGLKDPSFIGLRTSVTLYDPRRAKEQRGASLLYLKAVDEYKLMENMQHTTFARARDTIEVLSTARKEQETLAAKALLQVEGLISRDKAGLANLVTLLRAMEDSKDARLEMESSYNQLLKAEIALAKSDGNTDMDLDKYQEEDIEKIRDLIDEYKTDFEEDRFEEAEIVWGRVRRYLPHLVMPMSERQIASYKEEIRKYGEIIEDMTEEKRGTTRRLALYIRDNLSVEQREALSELVNEFKDGRGTIGNYITFNVKNDEEMERIIDSISKLLPRYIPEAGDVSLDERQQIVNGILPQIAGALDVAGFLIRNSSINEMYLIAHKRGVLAPFEKDVEIARNMAKDDRMILRPTITAGAKLGIYFDLFNPGNFETSNLMNNLGGYIKFDVPLNNVGSPGTELEFAL